MGVISFRDVHGIADELGVDVQTVRRWIQSGKLRAFKPGKEYRVREADLEEFLAAREVRPKAVASPSQRSLFNGEERRAFIERWERYVAARVAHYENRLALERSSGPFAGYKRAQALQDEAFEEFSQFLDVISGEAVERWLEDPEIPEPTKEALGFELVEVENPFIQLVGRIGDRVKELADTQDEKEKAEQEKKRQLEEMREAMRRTA